MKRKITLSSNEIRQAITYFVKEYVDMDWDENDLSVHLIRNTDGKFEATITTKSDERIPGVDYK